MITDRRKDILAAAQRVFEAGGYAATTVEQIAAEAGVAKGSIYNYFHSKQDLFQQLWVSLTATDEQQVDQLLESSATASEKLKTLLDMALVPLEQRSRFGALVLEFWATAAREQRQGELAQMFAEMARRWRGRISAILTAGKASGEFGEHVRPDLGATIIMAMLHGVVVQTILDVSLKMDAESIDALKNGLLTALMVTADAQGGGEGVQAV